MRGAIRNPMPKRGITMIKYSGTARRLSIRSRLRDTNVRLRLRRAGSAMLGVVALAISMSSSSRAEDQSALSCISSLAVPGYAGLFWKAQTTGDVRLRLVLSKEGAVSDVRVVESPHPSFAIWLPQWFKKSSFLSRCGGKTLEITLRYQLEGKPSESPDNRIVVKYPDTFEIIASPPISHPIVD